MRVTIKVTCRRCPYPEMQGQDFDVEVMADEDGRVRTKAYTRVPQRDVREAAEAIAEGFSLCTSTTIGEIAEGLARVADEYEVPEIIATRGE